VRADDAPGLVPVQAAPVVVINGCHGGSIGGGQGSRRRRARVPGADDGGPEAEAAGRVWDDFLAWTFEAGSHRHGG